MGDGLSIRDLGQRFEDGLSARMLLSSIRRHLVVVLAFTLSLCAAGALIGLGLPAWFQAEGVVVIRAVPQRQFQIAFDGPDHNHFIGSQHLPLAGLGPWAFSPRTGSVGIHVFERPKQGVYADQVRARRPLIVIL